ALMVDDDLIGVGLGGEVGEVIGGVLSGSQCGVSHHLVDVLALRGGEQRIGLLVGVFRARAQNEGDAGAFDLVELLLGLGTVISGDNVGTGNDVGLVKLFGRPELGAVGGDCITQRSRCEMGSEGVGQTKEGSQSGTEQ